MPCQILLKNCRRLALFGQVSRSDRGRKPAVGRIVAVIRAIG
jgi:hypothetical protein